MSERNKAYTFPWEYAAMRGDELPDGLPLPDQMAYTTLRNIYDAYYKKLLSRDMAAAEKRKLRRRYEEARRSWDFWEKLGKLHTKILRDSELARNACRRNPTPENAVLLCDVLDGLWSGDLRRTPNDTGHHQTN